MKKLFFKMLIVISLCALQQYSDAQNILTSYDSKDLEKFLNSTTKVALIGNEKYDAAIKKAIEQYWKYTKVEYFSYPDMVKKEMYKDVASSYLLPLTFSYDNDDMCFYSGEANNSNNTDGVWLSIIMGGKGGIRSYRDYDVIAYAPFDSYANEIDISNCAYRLGLMVKGLQDAITIVKDKSLKDRPLYQLRNVFGEMNKKAGILKTKTLLVNENLLKKENFKNKFSLTDEVLKSYTLNYKIVPQSEIESAIKNNEKQFCYLCPTFSTNKCIFIYDIETSEVVYGAYESSGYEIKKKNITELNSVIINSK